MNNEYSNATHDKSAVNSSVTQSAAPGFPTYLHQPLGATVFQITLWSTIVFLGVIGNLLVCIAILRRFKMKTSMNYYLLSLAIADLGVLLIIYPMVVLKYLFPFRWLLGKQACYYLYPTVEIFFGASIWSVTVIAIERYRNIVGSKRYQIGYMYRSQVRTCLVIGIVWLASFLVSCVPLYPVMAYESTYGICYPNWPYVVFLCYSIAAIVVWYALPLVVIAFTYMRIKEKVRESAKFRDSMSVNDGEDETTSQSSLSKERREKRISWRQCNRAGRILKPLVILFAVTMFPLNAFRVLVLIIPEVWTHSYYNVIMGQVIMFVMINSSANPLVYYIKSVEFKDAFNEILKKVSRKRCSWKGPIDRERKSSTLSRTTVV